MPQNVEIINRCFRILRRPMAEYLGRELSVAYGAERWWQEVLILLDDQLRDLPEGGDYGTLVDALDIANCIRLLDRGWNELFRKKLSIDYRTWAKELMGVRNKAAHPTGVDFNDDDTWRALDTMSRLCDAFDADAAEEIRKEARHLRYGGEAIYTPAVAGEAIAGKTIVGKVSVTSDGVITNMGPLPSWRTIMEPHPDVSQGRYQNAEFAANLAQVVRGEGAFEYRDPVEFFARTYVTDGMQSLLVQALRRLAGLDGEPVIQLKTAFGGGKTHTMLAAYHLARGKVPVEKMAGMPEVLEKAGLSELPKVNVAVVVGTAVNPAKSRRPQNLPGVTINTIWGDIAAQLAISAGRPELYDFVKDADKKGTSPGSEALCQLFDACGPCLILLDELVAYAKKLYGIDGLPAGSFDNFISFIQEITEAAASSRNSLVMASIPESDIEIGGEAGQKALEAIEHTFGRMEAVWKPVAASEGFEVVRRRLFLPCKNPQARDAVCEAFSRIYRENPMDFPVYAREADYKERMISCYPIHPEIFDHLYEEWSTLERFQRTRGVLRLMAAVIHELWMNQDASPMIMPGSIPLDVPAVRDELTRYLSEEWNGIVDAEVDGKKSVPYRLDMTTARYGSMMASRRLTRTIMLGSAPTDRSQMVRGIESARIRLGAIAPEENIAVFNDALNTLRGSLSYLYASPGGDHYWYDTRPTLRKTMEDRAQQFLDGEVDFEIEQRLRRWSGASPLKLHICPASSQDVPDERQVRLVVLGPKNSHRVDQGSSRALAACEDILNHRGAVPRIYRNMLVFLAPDRTALPSLSQAVRQWLAWRSIQRDSEQLNLDAMQNRETNEGFADADRAVDSRLRETYCWLLSPYIDLEQDNRTVSWEEENIRGGDNAPVLRAKQKLEDSEAMISRWAPSLLRMKLDELLWRDTDEIQIKKLWDYFCTYCYLPRLADFSVLENCIRAGVESDEYFAYAEDVSSGRYLGLQYHTPVSTVYDSGYLVKLTAAMKQLIEEQKPTPAPLNEQKYSAGDRDTVIVTPGGTQPSSRSASASETPVPPKPKNTRFFLSTPLTAMRANRDLDNLLTEVINHLSGVEGAEVEITLDVAVRLPEGADASLVRTVTENCRTLKVKDFGFEE